MKVTNNKVGGPATSKADSAKASKTEGAQGLKKDLKTGGVSARDVKDGSKVDVSERAQMMAKAKEIASTPQNVDEAKVARLQKMIDEGEYKVDSEALADKLVSEHMLIPD